MTIRVERAENCQLYYTLWLVLFNLSIYQQFHIIKGFFFLKCGFILQSKLLSNLVPNQSCRFVDLFRRKPIRRLALAYWPWDTHWFCFYEYVLLSMKEINSHAVINRCMRRHYWTRVVKFHLRNCEGANRNRAWIIHENKKNSAIELDSACIKKGARVVMCFYLYRRSYRN